MVSRTGIGCKHGEQLKPGIDEFLNEKNQSCKVRGGPLVKDNTMRTFSHVALPFAGLMDSDDMNNVLISPGKIDGYFIVHLPRELLIS